MTRNLKIFFGAFILSLPVWWGWNAATHSLEGYFLASELARNPHIFTAQASLEAQVKEVLPLQKQNTPLELQAASGLSLFVNEQIGENKVLFKKDSRSVLPIASLTKLMGALVVARTFPSEQEIIVTQAAVDEEEAFGQLKAGDIFFAKDLLYPMLMESSNDASAAFALELGMDRFLSSMNREAATLGLTDSRFVNHAGLDPDIPNGPINKSSAADIAQLVQYLKTFHPSVFRILGERETDLYTANGILHHEMSTTNELLQENGWPTKVLGGKTGWTPQAQGTLVLVLESPKGKGYIVNVILGAPSRFQAMEDMVNWVFDSYTW